MPFKVISILVGDTPYGEHILSLRSSPFPLIVPTIIQGFLFDDTDTNIQRVFVYLLLIV